MDSCSVQFSSFRAASAQKWAPFHSRAEIAPSLSMFTSVRSYRIRCLMRNYMAGTNSDRSYIKFVDFALEEIGKHAELVPSSLKENFNCLTAIDGKAELQMRSFESPKIRLLRSLYIKGSDGVQVLDFAIFPKQEFDLPIFCANFFMTTATSIVVLDLNPLHDVINQQSYKEKYYKHLIQLGLKYTELFPWGGKLTAESIAFFSPIVIWTRFSPSQQKHDDLYSAFKDYIKSWLELMDRVSAETDPSQIKFNRESQHKYLTWRAEKDPGHQLLKKLVGEALAEDIVKKFLFNGVKDLGSRTFIDYFPEYKTGDGNVNQKRSMIGKSFKSRPWDATGEFIANAL